MSRRYGSRFISLCLAVILFALPAAAHKRVALVIGNSAYVHAGALVNTANDERDMGQALQDVGFAVVLGLTWTSAPSTLRFATSPAC
jgi:hypothetical protein